MQNDTPIDGEALTKSMIGTAVRHALNGIGVWAIAKGWVTSEDAMAFGAVIVTVASSFIWGLVQKWRAAKTTV